MGLVDVQRYLTALIGGERIVIDATLPGEPWDGRSSMPLACGPGRDYPAGTDPGAEKRTLEVEHCDPAVREPFIAALRGLAQRVMLELFSWGAAVVLPGRSARSAAGRSGQQG